MYHAAINGNTRLGPCVQCIPESGQPVVYHLPNHCPLGRNVVCNVFQNPVGLPCTMQPLMTTPGWAVVYYVSQDSVSLSCTMWLLMTARPGCCVQCMLESCQPVVYHAANNNQTWLGCCVQYIPEAGQPVVYHVANNDTA